MSADVGRLKVQVPDLGDPGGTTLRDNFDAMIKQMSDATAGRYQEFSAVADSTTVELDHNLGANLIELNVYIYTGAGASKSLLADYANTGYAVAEKTGSEKTVLEITTPGSGGPHNFVVIVRDGGSMSQFTMRALALAPVTPPAGVYVPFWHAASGRYMYQTPAGTPLLIDSGGQAGGLNWNVVAGSAPSDTTFDNDRVFVFQAGQGQQIIVSYRVPREYVPGRQIKLRFGYFVNATSNTVLFSTVTTLTRADTDAVDSSANSHPSGNSALALGSPAKRFVTIEVNLTDASGEINSVAVNPNDRLRILLTRGSDSATEDAYLLPAVSGVLL